MRKNAKKHMYVNKKLHIGFFYSILANAQIYKIFHCQFIAVVNFNFSII